MRRRPVNHDRSDTAPLPEAGSRHGLRRDPPGTPRGTGPTPPPWAREPTIYCAYPRAFSAPGTLDGVTEKLQEIRALGADILWLLPIHPIGKTGRKGDLGSPYAIRDYLSVNPEYGDADGLTRLAAEAHAVGLRVILDCVLNHGAPDQVMGAIHPDWFARDARGRPTRRVRDWSDVVDWNFGAPGLVDHLMESVEYWVRHFDIDGYRCDVAGMVPGWFWQQAAARLAAIKPDHFLLAEWDDPAIHRVGFHASYDWQLYRAMRGVTRGPRAAADLARLVARRFHDFPEGAIPMRFVENHDERRAGLRLGSAARGASLFAALAGGAFLVYNGQEVGARHRPSLFDRDSIDWDVPDAAQHREWLQTLLSFRRQVSGFSAPEAIATTNPTELAAFRRRGPLGELLVVFNAGSSPVDWPVEIDCPEGEVLLAGAGTDVAGAEAPGTWLPGDRIPSRSALAILSP